MPGDTERRAIFHRDWRTEGSAALDDSPAHARGYNDRFAFIQRTATANPLSCVHLTARVRFARGSQARSLVRLWFRPRIMARDGVSPDRLLGSDECWSGRGRSYTDMVNELLPSVSSRLWCYVNVHALLTFLPKHLASANVLSTP